MVLQILLHRIDLESFLTVVAARSIVLIIFVSAATSLLYQDSSAVN
jgi:hypothetical protein